MKPSNRSPCFDVKHFAICRRKWTFRKPRYTTCAKKRTHYGGKRCISNQNLKNFTKHGEWNIALNKKTRGFRAFSICSTTRFMLTKNVFQIQQDGAGGHIKAHDEEFAEALEELGINLRLQTQQPSLLI